MRRFLDTLEFFSAPTTGDESVGTVAAYRFVDAFAELPPLPPELGRLVDVYRGRFAQRHRAVIYEQDSQLVFIAWVAGTRLRVDELERTWELPDTDVVIYDVMTMPHARGFGLYPGALLWLRSTLHLEGVQRCWIYVEPGNAPSVRGIRKAGFSSTGRIRAMHFGGGVVRGSVEGVALCKA